MTLAQMPRKGVLSGRGRVGHRQKHFVDLTPLRALWRRFDFSDFAKTPKSPACRKVGQNGSKIFALMACQRRPLTHPP